MAYIDQVREKTEQGKQNGKRRLCEYLRHRIEAAASEGLNNAVIWWNDYTSSTVSIGMGDDNVIVLREYLSEALSKLRDEGFTIDVSVMQATIKW